MALFRMRDSRRRMGQFSDLRNNDSLELEERNVGFLYVDLHKPNLTGEPLVTKDHITYEDSTASKKTSRWRTFFSKPERVESHELESLPSTQNKTRNMLSLIGKKLSRKKSIGSSEPAFTGISSMITPGNSSKQSSEHLKPLEHLNRVNRLPNTETLSPKERPPYIEEDSNEGSLNGIQSFVSEPKKTTRYSIAELIDFQPDFSRSAPPHKLHTSEIFNKKATYEPVQDDRNLGNLYSSLSLLDADFWQIRCLGYMALVGSAAYDSSLASPLHFDKTFCDTIVQSINSLAVYRDTTQFPVLQMMLLDLALCFAWEQWNAAIIGEQRTRDILLTETNQPNLESNRQSDGHPKLHTPMKAKSDYKHMGLLGDTEHEPIVKIEDSFEEIDFDFEGTFSDRIKMDSAHDLNTVIISTDHQNRKQLHLTILPLNETFLLFCNLYLGSPDMGELGRTHFMSTLYGVIKACVRRSPCHQHRLILPLAMHSIHATQRRHIVIFFYEVLIVILQTHISCCFVPADLFAANSPVQALVQEGLLPHQPASVKEKANIAKQVVAKLFQDAQFWGTAQPNPEARPQARAPGAWNWSA